MHIPCFNACKIVHVHVAVTMVFFVTVPMMAGAQDSYPNRPIKIIVPVLPGATADTLPRIVAEKLTERWGQPVIIENRAGAASNLGADVVARAEPDGYTLLASPPGPLVIAQSMYPNLAFDPTAFVPVTVLATLPNTLVARLSLPVANLAELVANAKVNPGGLNYASAGSGSTPHLARCRSPPAFEWSTFPTRASRLLSPMCSPVMLT